MFSMVGPFLSGFGLALLIQYYQSGLFVFAPLWVCWTLLIVGIVLCSGALNKYIS